MDGIRIAPGYGTIMSVHRSFKYSLPKPYSNCLIENQARTEFQSDLFDLILNSSYRYTQSICYLQCQQRAIYVTCNCTNPSYVSLFSNVSQCLTQKQIECMLSLYSSAKGLFKSDFFEENCRANCPLECYWEKFDASLSVYEVMPKYFLDYLNSNSKLSQDFVQTRLGPETIKSSYVYLSVFYKSLTYEISTESPQLTLIILFANIGGYLGLFLGVSVFSLFEPFIVLIEIIVMKAFKN